MANLQSSEGLRWHPVCTIEKYSADQVRYARRHCLGTPWSPRHGDLLRMLFREPEDGIVHDEGNGVTAAGLANLALLLSGTGGHPLAEGHAAFGVGTDAAPFHREQVKLGGADGEGPEHCWYRPMDAGYPRAAVATAGVIEGQCTFAEAEACFTWREWCIAAGPVKPASHYALVHAYGGQFPAMINRKASLAGYGEKTFGVAWVFRCEIRLQG
jgi:hypothetical protein